MKNRFPIVNKTVTKSLTKLEKTKIILVGGILAVGLAAAVGPTDADAGISSGAKNVVSIESGYGALLMHPPTSEGEVAWHESHWSHSSHSSHQSHYSSRY